MKVFLIHHDDLDGYAAGAVALLKYSGAETLSLGYDDASLYPKPDYLKGFDEVIIVDYTLPAETMLWLKQNSHLVWIDHHYSSIMQSKEMGYDDVDGLRCAPGELICGAELAWKYFVGGDIPWFLKLVGDYDTFRNSKTPEFNDVVMPFFYSTQIHADRIKPSEFHKEGFLLKTEDDFRNEAWTESLIAQGRAIQAYNKVYYKDMTSKNAFTRNIWGLRVVCFNCPGHGSSNIQPAFNPEEHDAMLRYAFNGTCWNYGLYADTEKRPDVDCSKIARQYGGGGHRAAAGFTTDKLLAELQ